MAQLRNSIRHCCPCRSVNWKAMGSSVYCFYVLCSFGTCPNIFFFSARIHTIKVSSFRVTIRPGHVLCLEPLGRIGQDGVPKSPKCPGSSVTSHFAGVWPKQNFKTGSDVISGPITLLCMHFSEEVTDDVDSTTVWFNQTLNHRTRIKTSDLSGSLSCSETEFILKQMYQKQRRREVPTVTSLCSSHSEYPALQKKKKGLFDSFFCSLSFYL